LGRGLSFEDFRTLLIIIVCGVVGVILTMMFNMAVTDDIIVMSTDNVERFSVLIILMSLVLGTIIGVASSK
jgi:H+/Cl- antiporter ClcA